MSHHLDHLHHGRRRGFTLVELLVVIAIIALLIAVLLPSLKRAKEQMNKLTCLNNLHNLQMAILLYASENRQRYPSAEFGQPSDWICRIYLDGSSLLKYLGKKKFDAKLYRCPSHDAIEIERDSYGGNGYPYSYSMNVQFVTIRTAKILNSSQKIVLVEDKIRNDSVYWWFANGQSKFADGKSNPYANLIPDTFSFRHGGGKQGNVSFADGHVESVVDARQNDPAYWNAYPNQRLNTGGPAD